MALKCLQENNEIKGKLHRMSCVYTLRHEILDCWVFLLMKMQIFGKCQSNLMKWWKASFWCGGSLWELLRRWVYYYPQPIHWTEAFDDWMRFLFNTVREIRWKWVSCTPEHYNSLANMDVLIYNINTYAQLGTLCSVSQGVSWCSFEAWNQRSIFFSTARIHHVTFMCKSLINSKQTIY